jgi:protein arginine kinase
MLSSSEAMNLLSLLRLGVDLGVFAEDNRAVIDRLFIEAQPGHILHLSKQELETNQRDMHRAERLRQEFGAFAKPNFALPPHN